MVAPCTMSGIANEDGLTASSLASSKHKSLSEKNLLDHVNKIRQAPSFAGFEAVLRMTGDDWMEAMVQQARLIRSNWA